jgi:hypothetical protein
MEKNAQRIARKIVRQLDSCGFPKILRTHHDTVAARTQTLAQPERLYKIGAKETIDFLPTRTAHKNGITDQSGTADHGQKFQGREVGARERDVIK